MFVLHVLADGLLVVLGHELDPLAGLLLHGDHALLERGLTLTEALHVLLLVLLLEGGKLGDADLGFLGGKEAAGLAHDDSAEDNVVLVLHGAVKVAGELTVEVACFAHSELGVRVLVDWLLATEKVAL